MRSASNELKALLANKTAALTTADLYQFTLRTGVVIRWTSFDADIIYGGNTYAHGPQTLSRTALKQQRGLAVDKVTITIGSLSSQVIIGGAGATYSTLDLVPNVDLLVDFDALSEAVGLSLNEALIGGLFDGAAVRIYRVFNPVILADGSFSVDATPYGAVLLFVGLVSDVGVNLLEATINCASMLELLNQNFPLRVWQPDCSWTTYDAGCGLNRANFTVTGVIAQAGTTTRQLIVPSLNIPSTGIPGAGTTMPNGWLDQGEAVCTAGRNVGQVRSIKLYLGSGSARSYPSTVLRDTPLAYFRLGEVSGNLADSSGNGYVGTPHGSLTYGATGALNGDSNKALSFDGSSAYLTTNVPDPKTTTDYAGATTFELWAKPNAASFFGLFDSHPGAGGFQNYARASLGYSNSAVEWNDQAPIVGFALTPGVWSHLVCIFRGGRFIDVYVNGVYTAGASSDRGDGYPWGTPTFGHVVAAGGSAYFAGSIDEIAIYNYPLAEDQIFTHYSAGLTAPSTNISGTVELFAAFPADPTGDTFSLTAGDDHTQTTCMRKFANIGRFGGAPFFPNNESSL